MLNLPPRGISINFYFRTSCPSFFLLSNAYTVGLDHEADSLICLLASHCALGNLEGVAEAWRQLAPHGARRQLEGLSSLLICTTLAGVPRSIEAYRTVREAGVSLAVEELIPRRDQDSSSCSKAADRTNGLTVWKQVYGKVAEKLTKR